MDERKPAAESTPEGHLHAEIQLRIERLNSLVDGRPSEDASDQFWRHSNPAAEGIPFSGRPSGIFQPCPWEFEALGTIGAKDVLWNTFAATNGFRTLWCSMAKKRCGTRRPVSASAGKLTTSSSYCKASHRGGFSPALSLRWDHFAARSPVPFWSAPWKATSRGRPLRKRSRGLAVTRSKFSSRHCTKSG